MRSFDDQMLQAFGSALDRIHRRPHVHLCEGRDCLTVLTCYAGDDRCPIGDHWTCPACDDLQRDAYFSRQAAAQELQ